MAQDSFITNPALSSLLPQTTLICSSLDMYAGTVISKLTRMLEGAGASTASGVAGKCRPGG